MAIRTRVAPGILHPLYRAVFAWGHDNISTEGRFLAAVRACRAYAVLSRFSAAALHMLVTWDGRPFEITAPSKRRHPRITAHRSQSIERVVVKGIPVMPTLRTVIDLARVEEEAVVKRALRAARFSVRELELLPKSILEFGAGGCGSSGRPGGGGRAGAAGHERGPAPAAAVLARLRAAGVKESECQS